MSGAKLSGVKLSGGKLSYKQKKLKSIKEISTHNHWSEAISWLVSLVKKSFRYWFLTPEFSSSQSHPTLRILIELKKALSGTRINSNELRQKDKKTDWQKDSQRTSIEQMKEEIALKYWQEDKRQEARCNLTYYTQWSIDIDDIFIENEWFNSGATYIADGLIYRWCPDYFLWPVSS